MGLLSRASVLDENEVKPGLAFSDFITKYSLKKCAVLEQNNNDYFITHSIGFDSLSIISATSTSDFWNGICKQAGNIYHFSGNETSPFVQLFSEKYKYELKEIFVYKNQSSKILISFTEISNSAAEDFENISDTYHELNIFNLNSQIKENYVVLKFNLDFSEAIESFISSHNKNIPSLSKTSAKAIMDEIYNRFIFFYNTLDSTLISDEYKLKTVFITERTYSNELITNHLILNLREVLDNFAELIQIEYCQTADSCEQVQNFLQAE